MSTFDARRWHRSFDRANEAQINKFLVQTGKHTRVRAEQTSVFPSIGQEDTGVAKKAGPFAGGYDFFRFLSASLATN